VQFFSAQVDGFEGLVTTLDVDDHIYPPQEKSFRLLSYFGRLADEYEWFLRIDDDSIIQWEALSRFLSKIDSSKYQMIGSPGFGRNADDYVPADKAYCMGGPGIIFSSSLARDIRPHVPACTKKILTDHEDIELCRCIWEKLDVDCTKSWEMNEIIHNNWKKHVEPGEIGYRVTKYIVLFLDFKARTSSELNRIDSRATLRLQTTWTRRRSTKR
jgi:chondroitin sulfate synthase